MSRQALLLVLLVAVLGAQARTQHNGKRKSGRRAVLSQQPAPGADADNTDIYEYYDEYDGYEEYENGGKYYYYYYYYYYYLNIHKQPAIKQTNHFSSRMLTNILKTTDPLSVE
jgi:hypothetical protein